jgi:parallel beta-helix repeat protein
MSISLISAFIIVFVFALAGQSKSLYVNVIDPGTVKAYKIVGDHIQHQTDAQNLVYYGNSPVGITLDPDSGIAFITYEGMNVIELLNAKTMVSLQKITTVSDAFNLSGIAFDQSKQKLYVVYRPTNHLFVYFWNARTKTLEMEGGTYKILNEIAQTYGLALDNDNNSLYVTDGTNTVNRYNTGTWQHKGSIPIVVGSTPMEAVGIAIDSQRRYMYTGSFTGQYGSHTYLVRTNIADPNNPSFSEKNIGAYVIGLAIDEETGYLYVTAENNTLHVYNTLTWPSDPCYVESSGIIDPAGMCLGGDIEYKPAHFLLTKDDNIPDGNCVLPDVYITYTISYDANGHSDSNVAIFDHLPQEVDYNSSSPLGDYNEVERTVSWNLWTVSPDDYNTFTLTVRVNVLAEPFGTITNLCEIEGDSTYNVVEINTPVCAWNPGVIYVDDNALGSNTGMSWDNAYRDLQDALERARVGCGSEIWVAIGTYKPTVEPNYYATFQLVDGVPIYGGFAGGEICNNQRNPIANQTILTGDIDDDGDDDIGCVVTASNEVSQETIIDGFTITKGSEIGIYCNGGSPTIAHNTIKENIYDGVYCNGGSPTLTYNTIEQNNQLWGIDCRNNSSPDIKDCLIQDNATGGIGCDNSVLTVTDCVITRNGSSGGIYGTDSQITGSNCIIEDNNSYGIYCSDSNVIINRSMIELNSYIGLCCLSYSTLNLTNSVIRFNGICGVCLIEMSSPTIIKNNWIHNNLADIHNDYGYGIYVYNSVSAIIRNNTIVNNANYGIYRDAGTAPDVSNCIIWENGAGQLYNCNASYSCMDDPVFINPSDPNDFHISKSSPCKDTGDPNGNYDGETDIDGEDRVKYGRVDIGGDEYYLSPADFYIDLIVNFLDYAKFALNWQSSSGEPDYNDIFDLEDNNSIDYADLAVFCEDWLWQAGWTKTFTCGAGQGMSQTMAAGFIPAEVSYPSISPEQQIEKAEPLKVEQLIDWLEELWLDEETKKLIDEDVLIKFIESLKEDYKIR